MTAAKAHIEEEREEKEIPVLELYIPYNYNKKAGGILQAFFIFDPITNSIYNGGEFGDYFYLDDPSCLIHPCRDDDEEEVREELPVIMADKIIGHLLDIYNQFDINEPVYTENEEDDDAGGEVSLLDDTSLVKLINTFADDYTCLGITAYTVVRSRRDLKN